MKNLGKSFYTRYKDYLPALGAIIALGVISTILIDGFMNVNSIGAILLRSSVLAMVAMGVTFVVIAGDSGLDLSTGALMVVGAMIGPNLRVGGEESLILSFLLVFVVGAAIGCINGLGVYFLKIPALVMTMAMNGLVAGYCIMLTHSQLTVNIPKSLADLNTVAFGPIRKMTLLIIILMILLQLFLTKSKFGQMLLPYARKMVGLEYEFEKNVRRKIHQDSGNIVLGSIPSMKQHAITALIAGFLNENPDMTLQTIEGDSTFVKELLTDGKCDIAFLRSESSSVKEFNSIPYMIDYLTAVLPATHPLAKADNLPFEQLRGETFLLFPEHSFINDLCIRECRNAGFEPHIAYTGNRGATLIDLVRNGAGITLMMHHSARQENDSSLAFIPVTPGIYSYISLNYAKEKPLSPQAESFVRYVKAHKRDF